MIFESLSEKLQNTLKKLKGKGKLTEKDINEAMREVKLSLLEADVNYKVVKEFIKNVKERAIGHEVMESLTPGQQVIKIVHEELIKIMGDKENRINYSSGDITYIMFCGLQGAGKTTTTGKLALKLKKEGKKPLLVACDVYRPAAIKQLEIVGKKIDVSVFQLGDKVKPTKIAKKASEYAKNNGHDIVIFDTAGRLHIDDTMMNELVDIKKEIKPNEILLVLDSMTGQDAVKVAETFNGFLDITGVILTKVDGDARGGAALSIKSVVQKPIKFVGLGEKNDQFELFYPDRMASRILGMGDVLSLIEKAQEAFDAKKAAELEKKIRNQQFTFEDFLDQMQQMKNFGPLDEILEMMPGVNKKQLKNIKVDEKDFVRIEAIIQSMTKQERINPSIIDGSRRKRIAKGSGTSVSNVNRLLKQYNEMKKMMKRINTMEKSIKRKGSRFKFPF